MRPAGTPVFVLSEELNPWACRGLRPFLAEYAFVDVMHTFDGNIRELHNLLEQASVLADGDVIEPNDLPANLATLHPEDTNAKEIVRLDVIERNYLRQALAELGGDKVELFRRLGISQRTVDRKLRSTRGAP